MLRPYFLHHRELLGDLARLAYDTVHQMMLAAVDEPDARPGMVAVIQTFASSLNPHIHSIVSRGVFKPAGEWLPIPYVDTHQAELLFRHKLLRLLRERGLIFARSNDSTDTIHAVSRGIQLPKRPQGCLDTARDHGHAFVGPHVPAGNRPRSPGRAACRSLRRPNRHHRCALSGWRCSG